jgi:hypothetical protein
MGYVAGLPFPHPLEENPSLRGQRIFWDSYYRYQPRVQATSTFTYSLDRFGNMTQNSEVKTVLSQLAYLSDVAFREQSLMPAATISSSTINKLRLNRENIPRFST